MLGVIKRFILVVVALSLIVGGGFLYMFKRGSWGIDDWVVRQVIAIADTYIVPSIAFTTFNFRAPGTVELYGVTFTSPDGVEVLSTDVLRITLAEIPRRGRPIVMESVTLDGLTLRLIRPEPGAMDEDSLFRGLVPFVREDNIRDQSRLDESVRLSNVMQIRTLSLINGTIEYDESAGQQPMTLTGITMDLTLEPVTENSEPGWYRVTSCLDRSPIFDLDLEARLNLDTFSTQFNPLRVRINLGEDTYDSLPPQLQQLVRNHEAVGKIEFHLSGDVNARDPMASNVEASLWIDELNFAYGEYRLPINEGRFEMTLSESALDFSRAFIEFLDGSLTLSRISADLSQPDWPTSITWQGSGLRLRNLLRARTTSDELPRIAGVIQTTGDTTFHARTGVENIAGAGEIRVTEGRLVNLPTVQGLINAMNIASHLRRGDGMNDTLLLVFDLTPDAIRLTRIDLRAQAIAARGRGTIGYDAQMDLRLNAGPLEWFQNMLGPIGRLKGAVTDRIMSYHVTGSLGDTRVAVRMLRL